MLLKSISQRRIWPFSKVAAVVSRSKTKLDSGFAEKVSPKKARITKPILHTSQRLMWQAENGLPANVISDQDLLL